MQPNDGAKVLAFDPARRRGALSNGAPRIERIEQHSPERPVAAIVTVTRFIDGAKVHAQVAVYADEISGDSDPRLTPELSELLADGAVEANSFLDRVIATTAARPMSDYYRA